MANRVPKQLRVNMEEEILGWCALRLKRLLPANTDYYPRDIAATLLSVDCETATQIVEGLFGTVDGKMKGFLNELRTKKRKLQEEKSKFQHSNQRHQLNAPSPNNDQFVVLKKEEDDYYTSMSKSKTKSSSSSRKKKRKQQQQKASAAAASAHSNLVKGRHPCDCMATKHNLIRNCMKCGKIICAQEGDGPCLFCEEQKQLTQFYNQKHNIKPTNNGNSKSNINEEDRKKALQFRDQLLEFESNREARTKIYDDKEDYFSSSQWLTKEQRKEREVKEEQMRREKQASKRSVRITFDLAGRRIVEASPSFGLHDNDDTNNDANNNNNTNNTPASRSTNNTSQSNSNSNNSNNNQRALANPFLGSAFVPKYLPKSDKQNKTNKNNKNNTKNKPAAKPVNNSNGNNNNNNNNKNNNNRTSDKKAKPQLRVQHDYFDENFYDEDEDDNDYAVY